MPLHRESAALKGVFRSLLRVCYISKCKSNANTLNCSLQNDLRSPAPNLTQWKFKGQ